MAQTNQDVKNVTNGYLSFSKNFLREPEIYLLDQNNSYFAISIITLIGFLLARVAYAMAGFLNIYLQNEYYTLLDLLGTGFSTGIARTASLILLIFLGKMILEKMGDTEITQNQFAENIGLIYIPSFMLLIIATPLSLLSFNIAQYIGGFSYTLEFIAVFYLIHLIAKDNKVHTAITITAIYYFVVRILQALI